MGIIISKDGRNAQKLARTVIEQEDYLQQYIYNNPDCLPLDELKDGLRLLILTREFDTPSGPIDALGVDADGEIYIIETKLYKNPDKRKVIAQMLDYGAAVWSAPKSIIERANETDWRTRLLEFLENDEEAVTAHLEALEQNAIAGRFRFVVLMDRLDDRLKTLISFVNEHSAFKVLGVELDFYQHAGFEIIIPKLFGAESATEPDVARTGHSGRKGKWDKDTFFANAKLRFGDNEAYEQLRELFCWSEAHAARIDWGSGKTKGGFIPRFENPNATVIFSAYSDGKLELRFADLSKFGRGSEAFARKLGSLIQKEGILDLPSDYDTKFVFKDIGEWGPVLPKLLKAIEIALLESKENS